MTKTPRVVKHLVGRDLELDVVKKVHRQLDRLPDVKAAMRVLGYIQAVTHEGSPAYAKQQQIPGTESQNGVEAFR